MKIIFILFVFFFVISCESKWENKPVNEFLSEKIIDTTQYIGYEELSSDKKINKITTSNCNENVFIYNTLVLEKKFIFIERKLNSNGDKVVFLKIDKEGEKMDSLIINRNSIIVNDFIVDKNSYCSWFVDNDKKFKALKNVDYLSKSDSTNIKSLVDKINKNNLKFYSVSEYDVDSRIDTCNYILLFKNNALEKYNIPRTADYEEHLGTNDKISQGFSSRFEKLNAINPDELFRYDNFYAYSYDKKVRDGISGGDLFSNTGTTVSYCNSYNGTYFITLQNKSNLKLKLMNEQICESKDAYGYAGQVELYTESSLDFYLIHSDVYHYYIVKK
jgi:hypothetical protein